MYEFSFHPSLDFLLDLANLWASWWIWKLLYAPMGYLTRFSKPNFLLFRMASLYIRISHVIIYFRILVLHKVGYCTLIEYISMLCSNFSLLGVNFACLISNFVSVIVLSLGLNLHTSKKGKDNLVSHALFCTIDDHAFLLSISMPIPNWLQYV